MNLKLDKLLEEGIEKVVVEEVQTLRESSGMGMCWCLNELKDERKNLFKQNLLTLLPELDTLDDIKKVIKVMLVEDL